MATTPFHAETLDELLAILANEDCRATLEQFRRTSEETVPVEDLADELCRDDERDPDRFAVRLHHSVLPRLADVGVLEYDARSETVRYRGHDELEALLDAVRNATESSTIPTSTSS